MDLPINVLAVVAAIAAAVYWLVFCTRQDPGLAGAAVKTASTALLALALWSGPGLPAHWAIALGMTFGAIGDWFLARRGEAAFLAGMAAFGAGHLAYAGGLAVRSSALGFDAVTGPEAAALVVLLGLVLSTEIWLAPRTGALRWPVRAYVLVIGLMGVAVVLLPAHPGQEGLRLGATLFLASDLMLALRLFVVREPARQALLSRLLWPAYWLGQALIAAGAQLYWTPLPG